MKVKLKMFFKWGIKFEEKYEVMENGNREVHYANRSELFNNIIQKYYPHYLEQSATDSDFDEASSEKKKKNENLKTSPDTEQTESEDTINSNITSIIIDPIIGKYLIIANCNNELVIKFVINITL